MDVGTYLRESRIWHEVSDERRRQEKKWGRQHHPSLLNYMDYGIVSEGRAKEIAEHRAATGDLTWADIAIEELAEAVDANGEMARRDELIQLAAVIVAWIENIDRNTEALQKELTE